MFLTRSEIRRAVEAEEIHISPFTPEHLSPNSYDVTLSEELLVYDFKDRDHLDLREENPTTRLVIPPEGLILEPNVLYIGSTQETATSHRYIPMFEGRSSIGRLGINTHITAGFGDIGWGYDHADGKMECLYPTWTLEICVVHRVKVYPHIRIGQVYFVEPKGEVEYYTGKYSRQKSPQASLSHLDFR
jgi:dCTP deaminase